MGAQMIRKEVQAFEQAVKTLGDSIKNAGALWTDEKYRQLSASVGSLAQQSRELMLAGDRCCGAIDRFQSIAQEEY
jgi:hypothetical protein